MLLVCVESDVEPEIAPEKLATPASVPSIPVIATLLVSESPFDAAFWDE